MRSLIITFFTVFLVHSVKFSVAEPKCHFSEAQSCLDYISDSLNSLPKRSVPETSEQFDSFCNGFSDAVNCWDGFKSECMTPIQKELEKIVLEGFHNVKNDFCAAGSPKKQNYLNHAKCLNTVFTNDNTYNSIQYMMAILEKMLDKPSEGSMAFVCCGFNKVYGEVKEETISTCGADAWAADEEIMTGIISTLPNAICGGFEPASEQCQKVKLADGAKPTGAAKDSKIYQFIQNFLQSYISL